MKKIILLSILMSSMNLQAAAKNYISFIGGGGEPLNAPDTQFDMSLKYFANFSALEKRTYNVTVNFNGGHPETEKLINTEFKDHKVVENFSKESFDKMIDDYIVMLEKDPQQIPENGKLLIFINSHGGEQKGETHEISAARSVMTNFNTGSASGMVSLDGLAKLTALAEKKKIKMAIIDGSCHSGNSLKLANTNTCVISASGPKHYGFSNFADIFASKMWSGKNLEDIFLETREAVSGDGFPQISTPEGIQVQDEIYPLLTPYMYFHDEYRGAMLDKIDIYLKENAKTYEVNSCERQNEFVKLNEVLKLIEDTTAVQRGLIKKRMERTVNLDALREKIKKYRDVQEDYLKRLHEISMGNLQKKMRIELEDGAHSDVTQEELVGTDWPYYINEKIQDLQDRSLSDAKRKSMESSKFYYEKAQEKKLEILRDYPEYRRYEEIIDSLKTDTSVNIANASSIAKEAHKAYAAFYQKKQEEREKINKSATNACKDFVL